MNYQRTVNSLCSKKLSRGTSQSDSPRVTVVIPVYNREQYVCDAIDSILAQTVRDFELLVIDDGSTDGSREVVRSYDDPRLRLLCNETNQGIPQASNVGLRHASGEYLAFLDSDDWAHPERLAKQAAFLDSHPDYAAVGAWIEWMDDDGRPLGLIKRKVVSADEIAAQRLFRTGIENTASMARTAILQQYGHQEHYALSSDFDLWARMAAHHKLATLPDVLVRRRRHHGRTTQGKADRIKSTRLAIYAAQLRELGVAFSATDLERHYMLRRLRTQKFTPDRAYLEWAEAWFLQLQATNQRARCYPEPTFSDVLGKYWFKVCRKAVDDLGWRAWRRFLLSPLLRDAWRQSLRKRGLLYSARPREASGRHPQTQR